MTRKNDKPAIDADPRDCATAWFVVLERARLDNDFERGAEAQRQLVRLGVKVRFFRPAKGAANDR
ncbi:MAG: hypothetical protein PHU85_02155 [Phycisphaerae bacterium]|nr:hypothetical protein [Phycisphaerae bacterium]